MKKLLCLSLMIVAGSTAWAADMTSPADCLADVVAVTSEVAVPSLPDEAGTTADDVDALGADALPVSSSNATAVPMDTRSCWAACSLRDYACTRSCSTSACHNRCQQAHAACVAGCR